MTDQLPPQPTTPPPPAEPPAEPLVAPTAELAKRQLTPLAAGVLGLAIGAAVVGGAWLVTATTGPSEPATFTLKGTFALTDSVYTDPGDDSCRGSADSGYDDIAEGTSVTVYGAEGDVIATGSLGQSNSDETGTACTYKIAVPDVPSGEKFYKVEVSHRGTVQLTAEEAENGELAASLG
ncbi:hypothetical protein ACF1GY_36195 [Streptomyces sp. NPDC014684]|uniref:hypothetical protein n=1 Tax=Streptomyces sp. NPDC014684 TaxID=3364880 RepID=UPI0036F5F4F9